MKALKNEKWSKAVNDNLRRVGTPDLWTITSGFETDYYIWGGFIRDSLIESIHGDEINPNDVDYLIDHYDERYSGLPYDIRFSDFECVKKLGPDVFRVWVAGSSYDFTNMRFNKARVLDPKKKTMDPKKPRGLEYNLACVDLDTCAIAYSPERDLFYDGGAIDAIRKRKIDVMYVDDMRHHYALSRLVMHTDKLGFDVGEKSLKYVQDNYSPELDSKIVKYLESRRFSGKIDLVLGKLKKLKNEDN
jgi:hypothetical protein